MLSGIRSLPIISQDRKVPGFRDAQPRALLGTLEISCREDFLVTGSPPVQAGRGPKDVFIAVVEDYQRVRRVCGGDEYYAHLARWFLLGAEGIHTMRFRGTWYLWNKVG